MKWTRIEGPNERVILLPEPVRKLAVKLADKYLVTLEEVLFGTPSRRRTSKSIAHARHELWTTTMLNYELSYPYTGKMFGVNYTSVMRGRKEYEARKARCFLTKHE